MYLKVKFPIFLILLLIYFFNFNESTLIIEKKNYRINDNSINYSIKNDDEINFDFNQFTISGKVIANINENGNNISKEYQCVENLKIKNNVKFQCQISTIELTNINSTFILSTTSIGGNNEIKIYKFQINLFYFEQQVIQNGYNFKINGKAFLTMDAQLLNFNNNLNGKPFSIIKISDSEIVINSATETDLASRQLNYDIVYNNENLYSSGSSITIEPSIIGTLPDYLVNDGDDIIINTIGLSINDILDIEVFIYRPDNQWMSIPFSMTINNQIEIESTAISNYYGERLLRFHLISSNIYSNNYGVVGFAKPILTNIAQNFTSLDVVVDCNYLNNSNYPTYLRGLSITPVAPNGFLPTRLLFPEPQMVRGYGFLQCNNSKSTEFKSFFQAMPGLSSWNSIERKGGIFKFSGKYLLPMNENNETTYTLDLVIINELTIPCENITILKYWGNQEYNASCIVSKYEEPIVQSIGLTGYLTDTISHVFKSPFTYLPPTILNSTSTFYGTPSEVTIYGSSFCMYPNVTIGGKTCELRLSDYENDRIYCWFESDIQGLTNTHTINVTCDNNKVYGFGDVFIYATDECFISMNKTGLICSGNGICDDSIRKCICNDNCFGLDCSIENNGTIIPPIIDNTTSIIDINNSKFEIGLVQIREIQFINEKVIKTFNLTNGGNSGNGSGGNGVIWNLEDVNQMKTNYIFNTTLINKSIIKVYLTINSNTKLSKQYNFYGDLITILPNSVKYKIEITNWDFDSNLNSIELIFQSKLSVDQCNDSVSLIGNKSIQMYGDSIRSMELTLKNGQILIGTFSNRMKLDERIVKSSIKILDEQQSIGIPTIITNTTTTTTTTNNNDNIKTSTQNVFTVVSINHFKDIAIVDPNFGVLIENDLSGGADDILDECGRVIGKTKEKFANWKIALIVVFSFVGISLIIVSIIVYKTRGRNSLVVNGVKLKMNKENK
ncbi:hypothetical protein ACTFIZ_010560 [Dictyostelium cf. discoideum]